MSTSTATAADAVDTDTGIAAAGRGRLAMRPGTWVTWAVLAFFLVNLAGVIGTVLLNSFGSRWFDSWMPSGWTGHWYSDAWKEFSLSRVLGVTLEVTLLVVAISLALGVPAAYALARRDFPGKKALNLLFVLPILVPPIAYGIPLATMLYKVHLAGTLTGVVLANLVPSIPFVVFTMTPFIEQIDPRIESAARVFGEVVQRWHQPAVLGEILAGVLLGPTVLGALAPEWSAWLFPMQGTSAVVLSMITTAISRSGSMPATVGCATPSSTRIAAEVR